MDSPEYKAHNLTVDPEAQIDANKIGAPLDLVRRAGTATPSSEGSYHDGLGTVYLIYAEGLILWVRIGVERRILLVRRDVS